MDRNRRAFDVGGILFGLILLVAGGYFILRNTLGFDIPDLNWDTIWPFFILALGASVLWTGISRGNGTGTGTEAR